MPTLAVTLSGGATSANIATTPNTVASVNASQPCEVQARNNQTGGPSWASLATLPNTTDNSVSFIAPSDVIRVINLSAESNRIEVFA